MILYDFIEFDSTGVVPKVANPKIAKIRPPKVIGRLFRNFVRTFYKKSKTAEGWVSLFEVTLL